MKITLYTIPDCQFSKQEKEYLNANKLAFEEKDLESNKDFLTEMLAISNNFAGTPVTRVEKDDGSIAVLKGFTKEEFDTTFGFVVAPTDNQSPVTINETPLTTEVLPIPPAPVPAVVETPIIITPDPLKSVMDDLQSKSETPVTPPTEQPLTTPPIVDPITPVIPDFPVK